MTAKPGGGIYTVNQAEAKREGKNTPASQGERKQATEKSWDQL
jgi:hypothetical protein